MATVAHVIRSYYDPADRDRLEYETGQRPSTEERDGNGDGVDPWVTESASSALRRVRAAPRFVRASEASESFGDGERGRGRGRGGTVTAAWYRSLTSTSGEANTESRGSSGSGTPTPGRSNSDLNLRVPASQSQPAPAPAPAPKRQHLPHTPHTNWFASSPSPCPSPAPSLADILTRDPPPRADEPRFEPPVWLHIGPSNRGFGMLERCGWREGEGLGVGAGSMPTMAGVKKEEREGGSAQEVVDLTLSDSDSDSDPEPARPIPEPRPTSPSAQRALLTPLPTVLKADRLGIGLKPKTHGPGPIKRPRKRVTHNAAALAAHVKAAEETRRKKMVDGRGTRGFARARRREEERRRAMLAYLNE